MLWHLLIPVIVFQIWIEVIIIVSQLVYQTETGWFQIRRIQWLLLNWNRQHTHTKLVCWYFYFLAYHLFSQIKRERGLNIFLIRWVTVVAKFSICITRTIIKIFYCTFKTFLAENILALTFWGNRLKHFWWFFERFCLWIKKDALRHMTSHGLTIDEVGQGVEFKNVINICPILSKLDIMNFVPSEFICGHWLIWFALY